MREMHVREFKQRTLLKPRRKGIEIYTQRRGVERNLKYFHFTKETFTSPSLGKSVEIFIPGEKYFDRNSRKKKKTG